MKLTLVTAPKKQPVTVEDIKAMVGLGSDQDQFDGLLQGLITAAVDTFEMETNTRLMEQTWKQHFNDWPLEEDFMELAYPPLMSVTSIKYTTSAEVQTLWASASYLLDTASEPGRVFLAYNSDWPTATLTPRSDAIEVEYVCGYENPDNVPYDIKNTLKLLVDFWFVNRAEGEDKIPKHIMAMIQKHRIYYL